MRTAVVSDLHLGTRTRCDLLRRQRPLELLAAALSGVDQLVLLGDTLELRDRPVGEALAAARSFFEAVGAAVGGARVVLVPGNHDHRLAWDALELRQTQRRRELGLVHEVRPGGRGVLAAIRDLLGTELVLAYPGFRLADGVWATHGHYLDAHSAWPTFECLASALLQAPRRRPERKPGDYEACLWPTYQLLYGIAQRRRLQSAADRGKRALGGVERRLGAREAPLRSDTRPVGVRWPVVGDRLGARRLHPVAGELRRPGVLPFARVLERLGVDADIVLFGHTHRTAPLPADEQRLWCTPGGTALFNTGSWVYEPAYVGDLGPASPYWPGTLTMIDDGGSPRVVRLLARSDGDLGQRP